MKLLIAYDGSEFSDAAIVDLRRAGLPTVAQAEVLSVAEPSPQVADVSYATVAAGLEGYSPINVEGHRFDLEEARALAGQAADRVRADFPGWIITTESWIDGAESAIVRKAHAWRPDLVVLGSHGHSGISRLMLGSVSQHVLRHTLCSVRISRHRLHSQARAIRLLLGIDGSDGAKAVISSVAARNWPAGTESRVIGVLEPRIELAATALVEGMSAAVIEEEESRKRLSKAIHEAVQELAKSGLSATGQILAGKPGDVLVAEAEKWGADCVFVGARRINALERLVLGSVSTAVASHGHCSVEIVRPNVQ